MENTLVHNWWAVGAVGVLAVLLGLVAFFMPAATLASMVIAFGAYALVSGLFLIAAGVTGEAARMGASRGWTIATGALGVIAGLVTMLWPGLTAVTLYMLIGVWALLAGITQIVAAVAMREHLQHTWLVALGGVGMAIFGIYMFIFPAGGILALAYALGTFAIIYGAVMIAASIRLKQVHDRVHVTVSRAEARARAREHR